MAKPLKRSEDTVIQSGATSPEITACVVPKLTGKLIFFYEWCKRCGICTMICPTGALAEQSDGTPYMISSEKCTLCSLCWRICPDFAIMKNPNMEEKENASQQNNT